MGLIPACSGTGNSGKRVIPPELVLQVPWTNGAVPQLSSDDRPIVPALPVFPPVGAGQADPGSRPPDCRGLSGIELSAWRHDFEPLAPGYVGVAPFWSAYDDKTEGAWHAPGDSSWYPGIAGQDPPLRDTLVWGLAADRQAGPSCDGAPNEWALHVRGGRFNRYGGGAEHPLELNCSGLLPYSQLNADDLCLAGDALADTVDLSSFDGVAFWARRGPDGAGGLLVGFQNKYTSDYLARGDHNAEAHCERIKECAPECANDQACRSIDLTGNGDEQRCVPVGQKPAGIAEPALAELLYPRCGESACEPPSYFKDADFSGTQCKPYAFSGMETNFFCFSDEPPPPASERCGDGFVAPVRLSTDWQLFKLPFSEFRQVGFAKRAPDFDLRSVFSIAFQFSVGFVDLYVDNVAFYRNK